MLTEKVRLVSAFSINGARGRTWTGTVLPPRDFKSLASTNFATRAEYLQQAGKAFGLSWMIRRSYNKTI